MHIGIHVGGKRKYIIHMDHTLYDPLPINCVCVCVCARMYHCIVVDGWPFGTRPGCSPVLVIFLSVCMCTVDGQHEVHSLHRSVLIVTMSSFSGSLE